jgi:hypothetical protein
MMAEEEISFDVAREILNKLAFVTVKNDGLLVAVRSLKAFRAVNVTFRDAFEEDKWGCKLLARYVRALIRNGSGRITSIDNLIKLHERERMRLPAKHPGPAAIGWIRELRLSIQRDAGNLKRYMAALRYKVDGTLGDWEVMHRAMLPVTQYTSLQKGGGCKGGGLPCGPWHVAATSSFRRAPHGTCAWCEALLMKVRNDTLTPEEQRKWAQTTAALILGISRAEEEASTQQYVASVAEMLRHMGVADDPREWGF